VDSARTMKAVFFCLFAFVFVAQSQQYCEYCTAAVGYIEAWVTENSTETQIIKDVEKICSVLPTKEKTECVQECDTNGPGIISMIVNAEPPKTVCGQLGLCSPSPPAFIKAKAPLDNCAECQFVVQQIEFLLESNTSETEIEKLVQEVCEGVGIDKATCDTVEADIPSIIQALENNLTPKQCCIFLGICTSEAKKPVMRVDDPADCSICVFAVSQVEDYIASNATETEIETDLNKACGLLGSFTQQCLALVKNLPTYIASLEKAEDPTTICTQCGICTKDGKKKQDPVHRP